jgi:hypothetical protein
MRLALSAIVLAAVAAATAVAQPIPKSSRVGCDLSIGARDEPSPDARIVADRIALPRARYPHMLARTRSPVFRFSAKWGAELRGGTGQRVTVSVARPWRRHAKIGWGNGTATSVTFLPCTSRSPWIAYAGGFELRKRGCVPFDVRVAGRIHRIRIGFGRSC